MKEKEGLKIKSVFKDISRNNEANIIVKKSGGKKACIKVEESSLSDTNAPYVMACFTSMLIDKCV